MLLGTPTGVEIKDDDTLTLVNSSAEFTFLTYTMPGGTMNMANELEFNLDFALSTRALLPGSLTIRVKYGTSTLTLGGGALALLGGASNTPFQLSGVLANRSTPAAQFLRGEIRQGTGGLSLGQPVSIAYTSPAVDSTADQTFIITGQFSTADAANSLVLMNAKAELS